MPRRFIPAALSIAFLMTAVAFAQRQVEEMLRAARPRCEHLVAPLGIDVAQPRLSWIVESPERDQRQTAYQIVVGTDRAAVAHGVGDLWDTTKVASDETLDVVYNGKPLESHQLVHWSVRVWDRNGMASAWSEPATFSTGLLQPSEWVAQWIGFDEAPVQATASSPLADAKWLMFAHDDAGVAQAGVRAYGSTLTLPDRAVIEQSELFVTADDSFTFCVNGKEVGKQEGPESWRDCKTIDLNAVLTPGVNMLRAQVENTGESPTGLLATLVVTLADGRTIKHTTDESWHATDQVGTDWATRPMTPEAWPSVKVLGRYGMAPWGEIRSRVVLLSPTKLLRTRFSLDRRVRCATLYATALGIADVYLNGERVADEYFNPGWTDYTKRVYYRTYDVTDRVQSGENALGAELADGWFSGYIGWLGQRDHYGKRPRFAAQLHVEYADGSVETVATGPEWKAATGATREADLLMGQTYDARLERDGWSYAQFDDSTWSSVDVGTSEVNPLVQWHPSQPVRAFEEFRAVKTTEPKQGTYVLDLGQNFAGVVRLRATDTKPGQKITLRFAERLNPDGTIYTANLRGARATDAYICRGDTMETWAPRFTFHGFQFVEVTGLSAPPTAETIVGLALSSDTPVVGTFETSDPMLNRLHKNIYYTQRMNFIDVPTDCPQRDERLGWTADAQVYVDAAVLNADVQPFFTKWLLDLTDAQRSDGQFPMVAPLTHKTGAGDDGGPGWADAGVIVPWSIYMAYGDEQLLARQYASTRKFIEFCRARFGEDFLPPETFHSFGDWLSVGANTPQDVYYISQFAQSVKLTAKAAEALDKPDEARELNALFERVRSAFNDEYVYPDGRIKGNTQTCYVMALAIGLLDEADAKRAAEYLVEDVEQRGWRLSTGFIGTKDLLPVLSKIGRTDVAYRLLHNDTFPSWGFSIKHGATSIWERWDGWTPDKGFQDSGMNSFAHYSFGAVYAWMVENIGGIASDTPGWQHITIGPQIDPKLSYAKVGYDSVRGRVETEWKKEGDSLAMRVTVPANVTATVTLPTSDLESVTESGEPLHSPQFPLKLGSGIYEFRMRYSKVSRPKN